MRKWIFPIMLFLLLLFSGCSFKTPSPTDQLNIYLDHWKNKQFSNMYDMLSDETKKQYTKEEFVERYEKIYTDINIDQLKFSYIEPSSDELKTFKNIEQATIPIEAEMESIAGIITFINDIELNYTSSSKKEDPTWVIEWNPGLIFPDMIDGGKVQIDVEQPKRGEILDRNKMPLAINDIAYEVGIVPNDFANEAAEKEDIARLLGISVASIDKKLDEPWVKGDFFIPLKVIPRTAEERLKQLANIPAVTYTETTGRTYPSENAAAHLTGYVGPITAEEIKKYKDSGYKESDLIGKQGLELTYEEKLRGEEGIRVSVIKETKDNSKEKVILAETPVKNGENVQLTIDVNAQEEIFNSFEENAGTAAAINSKTGEVLALVSSPSYNPNEFTYGITQANWDQLMDDPLEPFVNRFAATYAPGSVIKTITGAIGLKNGSIKPEEALTINGLTWGKKGWNGQTVTRVSSSGAPVNLRDAFIRSDNIYFAMQAINMGAEKFEVGLEEFGFNEKIPLPIHIKPSQISNAEKIGDELLLAHTSYGQGEIEVSSLHMALTYTPIINDGNMVKPIILTEDKKGQVWKENLLNKEQMKILHDDLRDVVTVGTAKKINDKDFPVAGKTGTAELKSTKDGRGHENGWFVGYHAEDKDIIIAMMVEKAENIGASSYVAKQAKSSLQHIKKQQKK